MGWFNFKQIDDWGPSYGLNSMSDFPNYLAILDITQSMLLYGLSAWILLIPKQCSRTLFRIISTLVLLFLSFECYNKVDPTGFTAKIKDGYDELNLPAMLFWSLPIAGFCIGSLVAIFQRILSRMRPTTS